MNTAPDQQRLIFAGKVSTYNFHRFLNYHTNPNANLQKIKKKCSNLKTEEP